MDFNQYFIKPETFDIENLKEFFESYNLNSKLIGIDYVEGDINGFYYTFCNNEVFSLDEYSYQELYKFLFDEEDLQENKDDVDKFEQELRRLLGNIDKNEKVYQLYFKFSGGGSLADSYGNNVYLSDNDALLYTFVYALYMCKYHNGVLYYANNCIYLTEKILEELIDSGLSGKLNVSFEQIINKYENNNEDNQLGIIMNDANKGDINSQIELAKIYKSSHNIEGAIKYYTMALDNGFLNVVERLAQIFENNGNIEEAIKYYKMALEKGQNVFVELAELYEESNNIEEAINYFKRAANKKNVFAIKELERINKKSN